MISAFLNIVVSIGPAMDPGDGPMGDVGLHPPRTIDWLGHEWSNPGCRQYGGGVR